MGLKRKEEHYRQRGDVAKMYFVNADIAYLYLTPTPFSDPNYNWRHLGIDLYPPPIRSKVFGFGYANPVIKNNNGQITWDAKPFNTVGEVLEIYPVKRDSVMAPFPSFLTTARFDASMSGGPVFNEEGLLCGTICSDFGDKETPLSLVSTLWPSMATLIDIERKDYPKGKRYPILELAEKGFIQAKGWERITLIKDEIGNIVGIHQKDK